MWLIDWIVETVIFYFKAAIFLCALTVLVAYGVIHAAICGGPTMPDDIWWGLKIVLLLALPILAATVIARAVGKSGGSGAGAFAIVLVAGFAASAMLVKSQTVTFSNYDHAPVFWEVKPYSIEGGKLVVPGENLETLLRDCGLFQTDKLKDMCQEIVYCGSDTTRAGCGEILAKKTSARIVDLALRERKWHEEDGRKRGE
jgi:hypothetical protein